MKRSPMVRKTPMGRGTSTLTRSAFKKSAPKKRAGHDKAKRDACRDQPCYLDVPGVCMGGTATTVPCHANWSEYGKGMGLKAHDVYTVPGCSACHHWLDFGPAPRDEKKATWESAYAVWEKNR
jgi:hypothetical protein